MKFDQRRTIFIQAIAVIAIIVAGITWILSPG